MTLLTLIGLFFLAMFYRQPPYMPKHRDDTVKVKYLPDKVSKERERLEVEEYPPDDLSIAIDRLRPKHKRGTDQGGYG
jgi:hypothetical protein